MDVRDVADIHTWCGEHPKDSDGHRYIACAGFGGTQAMADILRKASPDRRDLISKGEPGRGYNPDYSHLVDGISVSGEKAEEHMRLKYIPFDRTVLDTAKVFEIWVQN